MDPGTYATRFEQAKARVCECGHISGVHHVRGFDNQAMVDDIIGHVGNAGCSKCPCVKFTRVDESYRLVGMTRFPEGAEL
jgi:hypothetical protein